MFLSDLSIGQYAQIINITAPLSLKQRLNSFGINKNSKIRIEAHTLSKKTIQISIERTKVALRNSEASKIEVEVC